MAAAGEAELICDFAETYHIYDWRGLPARYAAVLACGLRHGSRIMLKMSGLAVPTETLLLATIADAARLQVWQRSRDGSKGKNPPKALVELFAKKNGDRTEPAEGFGSAADFLKWREKMLGGE